MRLLLVYVAGVQCQWSGALIHLLGCSAEHSPMLSCDCSHSPGNVRMTLRFRRVKKLAQGHSTGNCQDSAQASLMPRIVLPPQ